MECDKLSHAFFKSSYTMSFCQGVVFIGFLFSPVHDVGKIEIPDNILRKPSKLNAAEFDVMKTHPKKGREIIDFVLKDFSLR